MLKVKKAIFAGLVSVSVVPFSSFAAIYVVAHPDDDILLMGPNLLNDIRSNYPTTIIVVTAGDAGNQNLPKTAIGNNNKQYNIKDNPYYRVRLSAREGALDKWIPSSYSRPLTRTWENFGGTQTAVEKISFGNVVEYHLNLPDDYISAYGRSYLQSLLDGYVQSVSDIEGLNAYSAADLRLIIRKIISQNNHNTPTLVINFHSPTTDGRDHPDHTAVGKFVNDAINEVPAYGCMWQAIYPGYSEGDSVANFPALLDSQRIGYERAHSIMLDQGNVTPIYGGNVNTAAHPSWMGTTAYSGTSDMQKGTMDGFHTNFYGKAIWTAAHPSNAPCAL